MTSFWIPISVVCAIWAYFLAHAGVSMSLHHSREKPLFTPTPYWCWISAWYQRERLTAAYMWYWTTAACTSVIYIVLFFYIRSVDAASTGRWRWRSNHKQAHHLGRTGPSLLSTQSRKMLMYVSRAQNVSQPSSPSRGRYPAVYIAVILPQSLIRWMTAAGVEVQPFWVFLSQCIFSLGGVCDALLLIFTRPRVLGFAPSEDGHVEEGTLDLTMDASTRCEWGNGLDSMPHSATVLTLDAQLPGCAGESEAKD